jgi:hypothetical protein
MKRDRNIRSQFEVRACFAASNTNNTINRTLIILVAIAIDVLAVVKLP